MTQHSTPTGRFASFIIGASTSSHSFNRVFPIALFLALFMTGGQLRAQLTGTKTIPGDYANVAAAVTDLNAQGVGAGGVIFNVAAGHTETISATISVTATGTLANPIFFQKSGAGVNPVITSYTTGTGTPGTAVQDGILNLVGSDYVTIDGIDLAENPANVANPATMEYGYALYKASATDGAQNNTIKNCTITLNRINNATGTAPAVDGCRGIDVMNALPTAATTVLTITAASGSNSNNKFYSNTIQNVNIGIAIIGFADVTPFTFADTGNDVGGVSASTGNTIKNYGGAAAATNPAAGVRTLAQYGLNVSYNTVNSNDGAGVNHPSTLRGIYLNTATSASATVTFNTVTIKGGGTTSAITAIDNQSGATAAGNTVSISNNTITGCTYTTATSGTFTGIVSAASAATVNINNNTLSSNATNATSGTTNLIQNTGAATVSINMNSNSINGWTFNAVTSGALNAINNSGGTTATALSINTNNIQGITYSAASSGANTYITNSGTTLSRTYSNNTFTNLSLNTTGSVTFFSDGISLSATGTETMSGNSVVTGFSKTGAGGTVTIRNTNAGSAAGSTITWSNNNFSNITLTGATAFSGFINTDGGSPTKTITSNTINNLTGGTSAITGISVSFIGGTASSISSNTIANITGQGAITGLTIGTSGSATTLTVSGNTITNITSSGTGGTVTGLSCSNPSTTTNITANTVNTLSSTGASSTVVGITIGGGTTVNLFSNTVNTLSSSGITSPVVNGISVSSGTTVNVFKNKIYDLLQSGAITTTSPAMNGMLFSGGTTVNAYNNLIGSLNAPAASLTDAIRGISVTSATASSTYNISYNTVNLTAASSGANFGTTGIFHTTSATATTATLNLRNNIIVNNSTFAGTGIIAAYRRSSSVFTNYGATSNNNLFYAGTPSTTNVIFFDGTTGQQTLAAYKALVTPRDNVSISENPNFVSTTGSNANFLHINTGIATQIEGGGANIAGITDDYDMDVRNVTTPDIGADEFTGIALDLSPPIITYTPLGSACTPGARMLTATITDASGVPTAGIGLPVLYWKINAGAYSAATAVSLGSGQYEFTLGGGSMAGDVISYYIAAQDNNAPTPNVTTFPLTGASGFTANPPAASTPPTTPSSYTNALLLSGTYSVGPTGTYATLTAAANAVVGNGVSAAVIFELQAAYTSGGETFPIVLGVAAACGPMSAVNTVTIRPETGATGRSINGSNAGPTIDINGGNFWRIDGRPGGTGTAKELTISNSDLTGIAVRYINEGSNNNVVYTNLTGVNTSATSGVVVFSTTTGANGNDNNLIDNCEVFNGATTPTNGIHALGTTTTVATYNDNNSITNCNIYNFFEATTVNSTGIKVDVGNSAWTISDNSLYQTASRSNTSATHRGLWITPNTTSLAPQASGFVITGNFIGGSSPNAGGGAYTVTSTSTGVFYGMDISVGLGTATSIQSNRVQNISFTSTSATNPFFLGISTANGHVNIGTITGNLIGSPSGTGSITITNITSNAGVAWGIRLNGGTSTILNCQNNFVGSITVVGSATIQSGFIGIGSTLGTTTNVTISNNVIGSASTPNSINLSTASTGTGSVTGISITTSASPLTINNNTIANLNNNSTATATAQTRGIFVSLGVPTITGNTIRNLSNSVAYTGTGFAVLGISQGSSSIANVSGNTIHSLSLTSASTTAQSQCTGISSAGSGAGSVFAKNFIHSFDVTAVNPACFMTGFDVGSGSATFANNMVRLGIKPDGTDLTTPLTVRGITVNATTANNFYFNSIYLGGAGVGTTATNTFAFNRSATTGVHDVRNNIFINNRSNATTGGIHYAVKLAASTTVFPTMNYNDYQTTGTGGIFANNGTTDFPVYVSGWIASDINSISGNPEFIAPTGSAATVDLHIHATNPTVIESAGVAIGSVTDDFDGQVRASFTPTDMGADAGNFVLNDISSPAISYTALLAGCGTGDIFLNGVAITDATGVPTSGILRPKVYYRKNAGAWFSNSGLLDSGTGTNGTWNFTMLAADMGGLAAADVVQYYVIAQDIVATPNISSNPGGVVATDVNNVTTPPASPNSITILGTLSGTFTVGATGTYTTLTAAAAAYNTNCLAGPVIFELLDPTYLGETFPIVFNANAGSSAVNTLNIKPASGVTAAISGTSASCIIQLNGADYVTIDGSNNGTTSRDLTFENTNAAATTGVVCITCTLTNGATNNTVKNTIAKGSGLVGTLAAIYSGSAVTLGGSAEVANTNLLIQNNSTIKSQYGIAVAGSAVLQGGLVITQNQIGSNTASDYIGFRGIFISNTIGSMVTNNNIFNMTIGTAASASGIYLAGNVDGATVSQNTVTNITGSPSVSGITSLTGIYLGTNVINTTVSKNMLTRIENTNTGGWGGRGIMVNTGTATSNVTIANNMISDVVTYSDVSNIYWPIGIALETGTGGVNLYYNSVNLFGSHPGLTGATGSAALFVNTSVTNLNIRNNIFSSSYENTTSTTDKSYAIYTLTANTAFTAIDYNDYWVSGTPGVLGFLTSDLTTLPAIQTGFGSNVNSKNVLPVFISSTNLHLNTSGNPMLNAMATPIAGITTDIDMDTRNVSTPDIGADEFTECVPPIVTAPTVTQPTCALPTGTIVVNASGGTLQYSVDNGANYLPTATFTGLTPGSYDIKVRLASDPTCMTAYGSNPVILNTPSLTWYQDFDGDNFGDPTVTQMTCTQPVGYVADNTDCDDTDANEFPGQTWYLDADGDDYSDGTSVVQCLRPANHYTAGELIATSGDCDDNDANEFPGQTWYLDADGDDYSNGTSVVQCLRPANHYTSGELIATSGDCDDNDANEFPGQTWYLDADGDDYSNGTSVVQCLRPANHYIAGELIATSGDCDDNDANEFPGQTWYLDADGDDYSDGTSVVQCLRPANHYIAGELIATSGDCDDTDANEFPGQTWYLDADGDDYSNGTSVVQCLRPANHYTAGELIATSGDCNDADMAVNPGATEVCNGIDDDCEGGIDEGVTTTYYQDSDGDTFGNPAMSQNACSPPVGYVANNTDCDDTDANEFPGQTWYLDADGDDYSNGTSVVQCLRPANHFTAGELIATSGDCNDGNAAVNPAATEVCNGIDDDCEGGIDEGVTTTYYQDSDGDTFGNPAMTQQACSLPVGYVANNTDCDDTDANEFPGQTWYLDADGDDYSTGATLVQCLRPANHYTAGELIATSGDCNDANAAVNPGATEICNGIDDNCNGMTDEGGLTTYYEDSDGDGFGNPAVFQTTCMQPVGYVANNTDCDDNDANEFPGQTWYLDADGDDYSNGTSVVQCLRPANHYTAGELIATTGDCNDGNAAVNPGATEVCNGIDDDCEGGIDEGVTTTYYQDSDGDTFGNPAMTQQACSPPVGYVANNTDCDDTDANEFPGQTWYLDADGDDYSNGTSVVQCLRPANHYTAGELIATTGDCNDANAAVYAGAPEICDGLDNDCNGNPEAATNTWNGTGNGTTWDDANNWSDDIVPLACQNVVIPTGFNVTVPAGFEGKGLTLTVATGALLTVPVTALLTIQP